MPLPLFALFFTAFSIGTGEFVIAGLLPDVSANLGVTIPTAGYLVTAYAIGIAIGGPLTALLVSRLPRKPALLWLIGAFTFGTALCALAPSYPWLMVARVFVSFSHGAFFGVAAIVATNLVPPEKRGSAVALLLAGITVANILGVPAGTAIGNAFGWRATFWAVGLLTALALAATAILLPKSIAGEHKQGNLGQEFRALGRQVVYLSLAVIVIAMIGQFSLFTYIAPLLTTVTGVSENLVPWLLLLFGVGSTLGVLAGGRLADWKLMPSLIGMLAMQAVVYAALAWCIHDALATSILIVLWGAASFAFGAPVQTRVLHWTADAPNLASTLIPTAFNIGIALGATLGAAALDQNWGYDSLPWIGFVTALAAGALALVSWALEKGAMATV